MTDEERLAEIQLRLDAATEGDWQRSGASPELSRGSGKGCGGSIWSSGKYMNDVEIVTGGRDDDFCGYGLMRNEDGEFIIHAKEDIQWLIERLREAQGCPSSAPSD